MKKLLVVVLVASIAVVYPTGAAAKTKNKKKQGSEQPTKLLSAVDSLSYAITVEISQSLVQIPEDINTGIVKQAIDDIEAGKSLMSQEEAMDYLRYYFTELIPQRNKEKYEQFVAQLLKDNKNIITTESGLMYEVLQKGNDIYPSANDEVRVDYRGYYIDGEEFDSSYERGEPAQFSLQRVIKGWTEGMQYVSEGGKIRLWIIPALGYGEQGTRNIGPNQLLIFDVELHQVIVEEDEPDDDETYEIIELDEDYG